MEYTVYSGTKVQVDSKLERWAIQFVDCPPKKVLLKIGKRTEELKKGVLVKAGETIEIEQSDVGEIQSAFIMDTQGDYAQSVNTLYQQQMAQRVAYMKQEQEKAKRK